MISQILPAYKYLTEQRQLNEDTIRTFHLGYVDNRGEIYMDADFKGQIPKLDSRFNNSTLFPIQDLYGSTIGVSCRSLNLNTTGPKYINTTYEKADHLYGLDVSWKEALTQQSIYLVEGNVDCLQMYQNNFKNVCALLGSNFSFTQLCLLSRFVKKIILVADGDKAGIGWRNKIKDSLDKKFRDGDIRFTYKELPSGLDPDNYLKKFGRDAFLSLQERDLL